MLQQRSQHAEPLVPTDLPEYPWHTVRSDRSEWKATTYLLVVDYCSRYIEVAKLTSATSKGVIAHLKSIFARHGIPQVVRSDNGPQYSADEFADFAKEHGFSHVPSSPKYPQSNGEAERAVKTIKSLLAKNADPYVSGFTCIPFNPTPEWLQPS